MLRLENINKKLGEFKLTNINLRVEKGDYFTLIGQSGAGKSMLLEIITGIVHPDSGNVFIHGKNMNRIPIQKRNIGIVYQKPTLFPHMTVFDNIAYPLKGKKHKKNEIKKEVYQLAKETDITHILHRKIDNLSGGEIQRATIARTLATKPTILLLDEPLSFLDIQLRKGMLSLLHKLNRNGKTIIHVTHDYEEALALSNKIAIIENGKIIQQGSPSEVFQHPASLFVANFVGISNYFNGTLLPTENSIRYRCFETSGLKIYLNTNESKKVQGNIIIPIEAITIHEKKPENAPINSFQGIIKEIFQTKSGLEIIIGVGIELSTMVKPFEVENDVLMAGNNIWITIKPEAILFIKKD